ncbi:transposase, partial [Mycoplasma bovis]|nr:transposase [Mycoplasmopsis bovis]
LLTDLSNVYPLDMAKHIYAFALLRSINPWMTNNKLDEVFNESFMSVEYPELKLGKIMFHH